MIFLGILLIIASLGILALITFVMVPRICLQYSFFANVKEASMREDFTGCVPDKENVPYVENYGLVLDRVNRKHYLRVIFKENVHKVKFYVVMFDINHKPIDLRVISTEDGQLENLYEVNLKVRGLYLQVMDVDGQAIADHLPVFLHPRQLIVAAVMNGLLSIIPALMVYFGYAMVLYDYDYSLVFPGSTLFLFIVLFVFIVACGVASYFIMLLMNRKYMKEGK